MQTNEELIRKITYTAMQELGKNADPDLIREVIHRTILQLEKNQTPTLDIENVDQVKMGSGRIILTAYGINKTGVLSHITEILAKANCDILDLSQKILQEYFTVIMIVDISNSSFKDLRDEFQKLQDALGIRIMIQHEDVFKSMHRI
jgi:ACT domain-containing protein